jgi:hypothetical protein
MTNFEFAMWTPDGLKIPLAEVIARLPPNEWSWTVFDLEGIGGGFGGYAPLALQEATRTGGVQMSSSEFSAFASTIRDLWWIVAIAHRAEERVPVEVVEQRDFSRCVFVLEGEDSGWWIARSPIGDPVGDAALQRIRAAYAHLAQG